MNKRELIELLTDGFDRTIRDPLWKNIELTDSLKDVIGDPVLQKLGRIKQTGPAYLVFPGAVHTRLDHSIGVYSVSRRMLLKMSSREGDLIFTREGVMSFLMASLMHDIGHFPYAHSLKELSIRDHEEIAGDILKTNSDLIEKCKKAGGDASLSALIIDKESPMPDQFKYKDEIELYRKILSGTLDPDKLDYMSRDAYFAGIPYGTQDTDRILSSISLIDGEIAINEDSVSLVDQMLFSKYMMYKSLYWNKWVRSATSMVKKGVLEALYMGKIELEELYDKEDDEFFALMREKREECPALELADRVKNGRLLPLKASANVDSIPSSAKDISKRREFEERIFDALKARYPKLKSYEAILDIPEPIHFESNLNVLEENKRVRPIGEKDTVFSMNVSKEFSDKLRKAMLFLPEDIDENDAKKALMDVVNGY